jgi:hypothetical protein
MAGQKAPTAIGRSRAGRAIARSGRPDDKFRAVSQNAKKSGGGTPISFPRQHRSSMSHLKIDADNGVVTRRR